MDVHLCVRGQPSAPLPSWEVSWQPMLGPVQGQCDASYKGRPSSGPICSHPSLLCFQRQNELSSESGSRGGGLVESTGLLELDGYVSVTHQKLGDSEAVTSLQRGFYRPLALLFTFSPGLMGLG